MANPVQFMIRVKLPSSSAYHSSPSGDSEYDEAYKKAIFDIKPPGFEVCWPRLNEKWPKDSEGYTFVPLYISDDKTSLHYYIERVAMLENQLAKAREHAKQLLINLA